MALMQWERVQGRDYDVGHITWRLRVPGGWLYRYEGAESAQCMVFVPAPDMKGKPA